VEPVDILRHLGGSVTRAEVVRHSSRWALEQAVRHQEIEKISRGRYTLPGLPEPLKAAAALGGMLSHASAADYWLMDALCRPTVVHVTVPRQAHRRSTRSIALHYADLDGDRVSSPLRTILECARTMPFREALAIADSALRRELATPYQLGAAADALIGPGSRRARRVAERADARAANPFESALRATVTDSGVGGFIPQLFIVGTNYRVDLGDPDRMIVLEADSFTHHGDRSALDRDCRRYNELVRRGWLVLRFSWEQVMFQENWVKAVVLDCCRLRDGRRGGKPGRIWLSDPLQAR
jgi:very-short-patch-repair endonuclease